MTRSQWVIWLVASGLACVYGGNICDLSEVLPCYATLVYFDRMAVPLFGQNETDLSYNCLKIQISVECIKLYYKSCKNSPDCDDNCRSQIADFILFSTVSSLDKLATELCNKGPVRQMYLENAMCLNENEALYASCHNMSRRSKQYKSTQLSKEEMCCYYKWYHDCFTNITRDNCGGNATFFVSYAVNKLLSKLISPVCSSVHSTCSSPPLPPEKSDIITTEDIDITTEESDITTEGSDITTEESGISTEEIDFVTEKAYFATKEIDMTTRDDMKYSEIDMTTGDDMKYSEIDVTTGDDMKYSEIDTKQEGRKSAATVKYRTLNSIVLSCLYIMFFKYYIH